LRLKHCIVCSLAGLKDESTCGFDYYEKCGIVDKSPFQSRWAIVAEDFYTSTSEFLISNNNCFFLISQHINGD